MQGVSVSVFNFPPLVPLHECRYSINSDGTRHMIQVKRGEEIIGCLSMRNVGERLVIVCSDEWYENYAVLPDEDKMEAHNALSEGISHLMGKLGRYYWDWENAPAFYC